MPFPNLTAAGFSAKEDSTKFRVETVDPSLTFQTEGGVNLSRRRFTRDPGMTIVTGFTDITDADNTILLNYYKSVYGGSVAFPYTHPTTGVTYSVRFVKTFTSTYAGHGGRIRWDVGPITLLTI